jgi:Alginate export
LDVVALAASALLIASPPVRAEPADEHAADPADRYPRLGIAGEHRTRYETLSDQFRPGFDTRDRVLALRTSVTLTAQWPRWRVVGELMDSRAELNDSGSVVSPTAINTLEPLQAYASWQRRDLLGEGNESVLDVGRMTVNLGKRRLLARNAFRNALNSFTGVHWQLRRSSGSTFRAFYLEPMRPLPSAANELLANDSELDRAARDTTLRGIAYELPALRANTRLELYALSLRADERVVDRHVDTAGLRVHRDRDPGKWHYEVELMSQSGRMTELAAGAAVRLLDHKARFGHLEIGYSFDAPAAPALTLQLDSASGDDDPDDLRSGRFDTLFGSRRFDFGPTGIYGPFARANLETPGLRLELAPARDWTTMVAYRSYRLDAARDAWTTTLLRDATGAAGRSLGRQLEASAAWRGMGGSLGAETGFAYFTKGTFVERTAPALAEPSIYLYAAVTYSF